MSGPAGFAAEQLRSFVERIERVEEEIATLNDDKKDIYAAAKANGFDVKILKRVVQIRRQDKSEREEQEAILDLYLQALGMSLGRAGDDEPDIGSRARAGAAAREDVTVQVVVDGKPSAPISLDLLNKVVDGASTAPGRAVLGAALSVVASPAGDGALGF